MTLDKQYKKALYYICKQKNSELINFATDNIMLLIPPTVKETFFLMPVELTGGGRGGE